MHPLPSIILIASIALSTLHAEDWQPEPGFISLFNGKDLTGWCFRAKTKKEDTKSGEIITKFGIDTEVACLACAICDLARVQ